MGVFISWSGKNTKSYAVADALRQWLEQVIQGSKPWMSAQDIDAGQRWGTELFSQLESIYLELLRCTDPNLRLPFVQLDPTSDLDALAFNDGEQGRLVHRRCRAGSSR